MRGWAKFFAFIFLSTEVNRDYRDQFSWFCKFCRILQILQFNFVHSEIRHQSPSSSLFFMEDFAGLREICMRRRASKAYAQQGPRRRWPNRPDPQQGLGRCRRLWKVHEGVGDRWERVTARSPPSVLVHARARKGATASGREVEFTIKGLASPLKVKISLFNA